MEGQQVIFIKQKNKNLKDHFRMNKLSKSLFGLEYKDFRGIFRNGQTLLA